LWVKPRPAFQESSSFVELKLYLDKARLLPMRIWYRDPRGSTMTLEMKEIDLDRELRKEMFDPKGIFPGDAEWIDKRELQ
jgi:hypothetical protein